VSIPAKLACPNRRWVMLVAVAAVFAVGSLDYFTGAEISIASLYLLPIALGAWFVELRAGLLLAGLSATARLQDVWLGTHPDAHPLIPYWNVIIELGFFVVVAYVVSRLRTTTQHWVDLARTDSLTSVLNRRAFDELATLELARAERYQRSLSLAYLDVDDFKLVNDRGGHQDGDRLLVTIAQTLVRNLRVFDLVARYGGDEFVLLLPEADDEAAESVLDKLVVALQRAVQGRWRATFSIGAVTVDGPRTTLDRLIGEADQLVYAAKQKGKNRVHHRHLHGSTPLPTAVVSQPARHGTAAGGGRGQSH
jgi:diguanylate cyclase (GGDEF)-like protein